MTQYSVTVEEGPAGILRQAWRTKSGYKHDGPNGEPSVVEYAAESQEIILIERRDGSDHISCENEPAIEKFDFNGRKVLEQWLWDGVLHRDNDESGKELPAYIEIDPETNIVFIEEYWKFGELSRESGAAVIRRCRDTGEIIRSERHIDGKLVAVDLPKGPASIYDPRSMSSFRPY